MGYQHMKETSASVLIIHGRQDDVIPFQHAKKLNQIGAKASKDQKRAINTYFPENCGHNDISEINRQNYYRSIHEFMRTILKKRPYSYGCGFGQNVVVKSMSTTFQDGAVSGPPSQHKMNNRRNDSINDPESSTSLKAALPIGIDGAQQGKSSNAIPGTTTSSDVKQKSKSSSKTAETDQSITAVDQET